MTRSPAKARPKKNLSLRVAAKLREEIISGSLAPGSAVAEIPTADRLGVSRLPVREATLMLEREGLLVLEGYGRRRVRTLGIDDLREILDIRWLIEPRLTALAAEFRSELDLYELNKSIERLRKAKRLSRVALLDIEFHDLVAEASGHTRLAHMWSVMRGQIQLFTAAMQRREQAVANAVRETTTAAHVEILGFIREQDARGAAVCVEKHLEPWARWIEAIRREAT